MSYKWSQRGLNNLRRQKADTCDAEIVLSRPGVGNLPAQYFSLRRVSQQDVNEGEPISIGGAVLEVGGTFDADIQQDDVFPWDGQRWRVTQPAIATETNTSVARRTIAVMVV